jgi:hypothetical protein
MARSSKPLRRSTTYWFQLIALPNSPSLTTSTPMSAWRLTTSAMDCFRHFS